MLFFQISLESRGFWRRDAWGIFCIFFFLHFKTSSPLLQFFSIMLQCFFCCDTPERLCELQHVTQLSICTRVWRLFIFRWTVLVKNELNLFFMSSVDPSCILQTVRYHNFCMPCVNKLHFGMRQSRCATEKICTGTRWCQKRGMHFQKCTKGQIVLQGST